ncbi:MAG: hypothetical protein Q4C65_13995, partial [Eubacteriales bacterium]|nr:hypothetical protein [Eubacteriales bacterium]
SFIYSVATQKETVMEAAFVNTYLGQDADTEVMASDFAQYSGLDTSRYQAVIDGSMMVSYDGSDQYSYANMQKLMAMVAAQTLDSVITDDAYLEQNLESGMFSDLSLYFTEEELAQYEDRLLYKDLPEDGTDEERPVAIDVRDSKYMLSDQVPAWFTIISNSKHPENAKQFLLFLLEE